MRSALRCSLRSLLVAFVTVGLLNLPLMAASERPLGMVVAANHAMLDHSDAANGADIYSDDALVTDQGGSLQFSAGASHLYLLSLSSASLESHDNRIQARIDRGTMGFSTAVPGQLEIQTPLGVIRGADARPVVGQVSILSSGKMQVSAYEGSLLVSRNGEEKTIAQGEAWEATLVSDSSNAGGAGAPISVGNYGWHWDRIIFTALIAGGLTLVARFVIWPKVVDSCYNLRYCRPIIVR